MALGLGVRAEVLVAGSLPLPQFFSSCSSPERDGRHDLARVTAAAIQTCSAVGEWRQMVDGEKTPVP